MRYWIVQWKKLHKIYINLMFLEEADFNKMTRAPYNQTCKWAKSYFIKYQIFKILSHSSYTYVYKSLALLLIRKEVWILATGHPTVSTKVVLK